MKPIILSAITLCTLFIARTAGAVEVYKSSGNAVLGAPLLLLGEDEDAWLHEHCSYQGTTGMPAPRPGGVHEFLFDSYGTPIAKEFACGERPPFWAGAWEPAPADEVSCVGIKGTCTPPLAGATTTAAAEPVPSAPVLAPVAKESAPRPAPAPAPLPVATRPLPKEPSHTSAASSIGYVLIGTGVVSLIGAGVAGGLVLDAKSTVNAHCSNAMTCDGKGLEAARRGDTASTAASVAFGVGAAALAGGVLLVVLDKPGEKQAHETPVGVAARPNAQGATFSIEGKF